jgi:hypothetical protein
MSVSVWSAASPQELNVANGNWARLVDLIGMELALDPWQGEGRLEGAALVEFVGRVRFLLDSITAMPALDGGTLTTECTGAGGCHVIAPGLRPGYFEDRLRLLLAIAEAAQSTHQPVLFG